MTYEQFLDQKKHLIGEFGFEPNYIPDMAFDFQKYIIEKAVKKGRMAIFADTGLGKTIIQLSIAQNIIQHTNKRVLILTPLAVAYQFIIEANKMGIDDVEHSKDGKFTKKIVLCNYERLHYFNSSGFVNRESVIVRNCVERCGVVIIQQLVCCLVYLTNVFVLFRVYGRSVYDVVCCHSHSFLAICNFFSISLTSLLAYCKLIP